MTKEEHNKIIDFVNSDDYMLLNSYISKPYEETIIEQDKEIERLNNIINEIKKLCKENKQYGTDEEGYDDAYYDYVYIKDIEEILKEGANNE